MFNSSCNRAASNSVQGKLVIKHFFDKKIPLCGVLGGGYNRDFNQLVYLHSRL